MNEYAQKIVVVLLNIMTTFVYEIIFLSPLSDSINTWAIITIFGLSLLLYIAVSISIILSTIICNQKRCLRLPEQIVITIAGLVYLTSDDLTLLVATYQTVLNCADECLETVGNVAISLLVASSVLFGMTTIFFRGVSDLNVCNSDSEGDWSPWKSAGQAIALIVEVDIWFSTIAALQSISPLVCPPQQLQVLWVLYGVTMSIYAIVLGVILVAPAVKENCCSCKVIGVAIIIWFSSAITIIADNNQPIGCLFNCSFPDNSTLSSDCNEEAEHGTRIGFLLLAFILLAIISGFLIVHEVKKDSK